MWCDQAIYYAKQDFIEAYGNVKLIQGDTIHMTSKYIESYMLDTTLTSSSCPSLSISWCILLIVNAVSIDQNWALPLLAKYFGMGCLGACGDAPVYGPYIVAGLI